MWEGEYLGEGGRQQHKGRGAHVPLVVRNAHFGMPHVQGAALLGFAKKASVSGPGCHQQSGHAEGSTHSHLWPRVQQEGQVAGKGVGSGGGRKRCWRPALAAPCFCCCGSGCCAGAAVLVPAAVLVLSAVLELDLAATCTWEGTV